MLEQSLNNVFQSLMIAYVLHAVCRNYGGQHQRQADYTNSKSVLSESHVHRVGTTNPFWTKLVEKLRSHNELDKRSAAHMVAEIYETAKWCPVSDRFANIIEKEPGMLNTMAEVFSHQSRSSTMKQYLPFWKKWVDFGCEQGYDIWPPKDKNSREFFDFEANFDHFAVREYERCRDKAYKNGKKQANLPSTYQQTFDGINHVLRELFNLTGVKTSMMNSLKRSYTAQYSRPKVKARPMLGKHLVKLVNLAAKLKRPWLTLVANTAVVAWMSSGRWDCINNINVAKSIHHTDPVMGPGVDPNGEYWLLYFFQRKNRSIETVTECLTLEGKPLLNPRRCFMDVVDTHNRALSDKWLPCCQKVYGQPHWIVVEDSTRACSYAVFLDMFREAMRLAGLEHEFDFQDSTRKWSLHAFRRGWVTNMRRNKFVVRVETIARHGNWSVNSVPVILSYADSTAAEHVQALKPSIVQALFG